MGVVLYFIAAHSCSVDNIGTITDRRIIIEMQAGSVKQEHDLAIKQPKEMDGDDVSFIRTVSTIVHTFDGEHNHGFTLCCRRTSFVWYARAENP